MISALAIAALLGGASCALVEAREIESPDGRLRLRDVVKSDCPALRNAGDAVIAALPQGTNRARLSHAALAALIRRRLPSLAIAETPTLSTEEIELRRGGSTQVHPGPSCFELTHAVAPRTPLTRDGVALTTCTSARAPLALAYDARNGIVRAAETGSAGHYLGQLIALPTHLIEQDEPLQLRVTAGPVEITREVIAVQPAHTGEAIFVRDADGHVFAAPSGAEDGSRR